MVFYAQKILRRVPGNWSFVVVTDRVELDDQIAKTFKADLARLEGSIARKAAVWLAEYMSNPDDPRFEAHRIKRSLMPNQWTAKLDERLSRGS